MMIILPTEPQPAATEPHPLTTALNCCQTIEKLAMHLQQASLHQCDGLTDALRFSNSGYLIAREVEHLRQVLGHLHKPDGPLIESAQAMVETGEPA